MVNKKEDNIRLRSWVQILAGLNIPFISFTQHHFCHSYQSSCMCIQYLALTATTIQPRCFIVNSPSLYMTYSYVHISITIIKDEWHHAWCIYWYVFLFLQNGNGSYLVYDILPHTQTDYKIRVSVSSTMIVSLILQMVGEECTSWSVQGLYIAMEDLTHYYAVQ